MNTNIPFTLRAKLNYSLRRVFAVLLVLVVLCTGMSGARAGEARDPERRQVEAAYGLVNHWELKQWKDNEVICDIYLDHQEYPTYQEITHACGAAMADEWATTPGCTTFIESGDASACSGSFLNYLGEYTTEYEIVTYLPVPEAHFYLKECNLGEWCKDNPTLHFFGTEPLREYDIKLIYVKLSDLQITCKDPYKCDFKLPQTSDSGTWLEYWVVSSYGDESSHNTIHLRNLYRKNGVGEYLLEVLSPISSNNYAAVVWDMFPTIMHPDERIYKTDIPIDELTTDHQLFYLAGKLINAGQADASECAGQGLLANGMANTCGEEKAHDTAVSLQNQYNALIYQAAKNYKLPAHIIKGVITQESQFWPYADIEHEYGLGYLSENGIDVLLQWEPNTFLAVCQPIYGRSDCSGGYASLSEERKAYLRGHLLRAVGTVQEIDLISRILMANTNQVNQIITNVTASKPGLVTTYEDMWDFTMASYHAGAGCIIEGLETLYENKEDITFANYCNVATSCPTACLFVEKVKNYARDATQ